MRCLALGLWLVALAEVKVWGKRADNDLFSSSFSVSHIWHCLGSPSQLLRFAWDVHVPPNLCHEAKGTVQFPAGGGNCKKVAISPRPVPYILPRLWYLVPLNHISHFHSLFLGKHAYCLCGRWLLWVITISSAEKPAAYSASSQWLLLLYYISLGWSLSISTAPASCHPDQSRYRSLPAKQQERGGGLREWGS